MVCALAARRSGTDCAIMSIAAKCKRAKVRPWSAWALTRAGNAVAVAITAPAQHAGTGGKRCSARWTEPRYQPRAKQQEHDDFGYHGLRPHQTDCEGSIAGFAQLNCRPECVGELRRRGRRPSPTISMRLPAVTRRRPVRRGGARLPSGDE